MRLRESLIVLRGKRFRMDLPGWRANLVLYAVIALIACIPAGMAFIAYAEGGTSLWAAIAFSVAVPGGVWLYLVWESVSLRRKLRRSRSGEGA
jgi:hypothetical protein